jgi:hypothetical protein
MTNHPNRSTAPVRFIGYSLASMNALSNGSSIADALTLAGGKNEFLVVAKVRSGEPLYSLDNLPRAYCFPAQVAVYSSGRAVLITPIRP